MRRSGTASPAGGDVARDAGVPATVSCVLDGTEDGRVSEAPRARAREAARQLGHVPHAVARALPDAGARGPEGSPSSARTTR